MKAGIQGAAGLNSEGVEGFPLGLSLRCPSTLLIERPIFSGLLENLRGLWALRFELGLIETTEPTGGTQHREYWGGPTNGQAAACRRRLAAVELATSCNPLRPPHGESQWSQEFDRVERAGQRVLIFSDWLLFYLHLCDSKQRG